ncbi:16S rRNA (guanine(966)-N(2))-methyltransferase RsmD [Paracandidimonas soli]|uniref:16S rRNA (Guanine(966)-N(2))-methyltransferase RsmD n=1 Tax=Paracandidimonas soli TaxID=1917182 RepID=A0A4R3VD20_9BURK|nr:16S rRNA (guanine(966)-N(2))-methyltransferase RsmD [Paracandidimonas soli]TCV03217.1 16S rRNA (guanine(966)-N(2))-methyltransferase RsmD [Paracandidimonas soli]
MKKHTIRIVGGDYRRTPIPVIDGEYLRPTPDRVRETLFNWLRYFWNGNFSDKSVLDLFAGSGALGFEAASHGVAHVQMVEQNPAAVAALRSLALRLKASNVRVHAGDALQALQRLRPGGMDLILLDPPFQQDWFERLWGLLPPLLAPDGLVYAEAESPLEPPESFEILRQGKAGQVHFHLLRFAAPQKNDNNGRQ